MPSRPTLTIPAPCSESWAAMTPAAQGRHCAACHQVVLDFTRKTDAEILTLLRGTSRLCGRLRPDQLNRLLVPLPTSAPRWQTWLAAAATVLGLREAGALTGQAQQLTQPVGQQPSWRQTAQISQWQPLLETAAPDPAAGTLVRGRVTDAQTQDPLPGVTVLVPGSTVGTSTLADGSFALLVPPSQLRGRPALLHLVVSSVGYLSQALTIDTSKPETLTIQLGMNPQVLGGLIVAGYAVRKPWPWHPRALWYRLTRPLRQ